MTPNQLLETLSAMPAEAPLVFATQEGAIGAGYHVTELKHAQVTSIDCGGRVAIWQEVALQLLDGEGRDHMPVGKFAAIVRQSIAKIRDLADCRMHVEFAHGNQGLRIFQLARPELSDGAVGLQLSEGRAHCKPAMEKAAEKPAIGDAAVAATAATATGAGCCGAPAGSACCQ
ncbi:DUF6428 family protein [Roseibium sp.]|uniref:DUF6428 family protein n=1 Tax=Roseibium sp. TaxID=1936156 RepID=UPI003D106B8A